MVVGGWHTCAEFWDERRNRRGSADTAYSVVDSEPHIRPLCAPTDDDAQSLRAFFCDEGVAAAPLSSVRRILDPAYTYVSEIQAGGGQGLGNPHGEHAEPVYDLRDVEVSESVTIVVREGRDTERVL